MKNSINILTTALLTALVLNVALASTNSTSEIKQWFGNQNFSFNENGNVLSVDINKNPWEAFTLKVDNTELIQNPVLNFKMAADQNITLRVEISNGVFMSNDNSLHVFELTGNSQYNDLVCDFSDEISDLGNDEDIFVVFIVNPGQSFRGTVQLQNVNLTNTVTNTSDFNENVTSMNVFPIPAHENLNVTLPNDSFNSIVIMDLTGKVVFQQTLTIFDNNTISLSTSDLPRGTFILKAFNNNTSLDSKIVLN